MFKEGIINVSSSKFLQSKTKQDEKGKLFEKVKVKEEDTFCKSLINHSSSDQNDSDEEPLANLKRAKMKNSTEENLFVEDKCTIAGYKNPFIYNNIKKSKRKKQRYINNKVSQKWLCILCNENCFDKADLLEHYEWHKQEKDIGNDVINSSFYSNDYFNCTVCSKEFTSLKNYEKHNEKYHGDKAFICNLCDKSYKSMWQLCLHKFSVHDQDKYYKCIVCDFQTENKISMKEHIGKHEESNKYECSVCGKCFLTVTSLEDHRLTHLGTLPFQCEICSETFPHMNALLVHKNSEHLTNADIRNECNFCGKQFAHKKSLIMHLRSHTGENSYLCEMCGKKLSSTEHLKQHIRIHTGQKPYSCTVCGKGFAKKCNLSLHERVHSGEKPNICKYCGKGFSQRSTLVIHERYHSGERPYVCTICNKGFVARGLLSVHIKTCVPY